MSDDGRFVDAFTARLFDFFFPGSSSQVDATATQGKEFSDTLCKAPARQQFYNETGICIPFYPSGLQLDKDPNTGFDSDFDIVESSFTMKCSAAGIPFNCDANLDLNGAPNAPCSATIDTNPSATLAASITSELQSDITLALGEGPVVATSSAVTADGVRNFGGVAGEIPAREAENQSAQPPPVETADGVGNFGGVASEIPASEAGQELATTSTTFAQTLTAVQISAQAAQAAQASIDIGDQGAVIVSYNPGGPDGTWGAVVPSTATLVPGVKARARHEADRAAMLREYADSDNTINDPPTITPAPRYPPEKRQRQKSNQNAASIFKRERQPPVLERSIGKRAEEPHNWCQESQLVISEHDSHSAIQVCESQSSWGPDFISIVEGVYCDMCKRQYYPLCGGGKESTTCFDLENRQLSLPARWWRRDDRVVPVNRYDNVRHWKQ
jgi:hypothetical protein